ncbi:hypothetical protein BJ138DRAFT_1017431, partial [Hygrophoropsis aurantiaca]
PFPCQWSHQLFDSRGMCYNIISYVEHECTHRSQTKRQTVDCNNISCIFSGSHPTAEHECSATCEQSMLPDQRLITESTSGPCSSCAGSVNGQ